jgi:hypothetical protein
MSAIGRAERVSPRMLRKPREPIRANGRLTGGVGPGSAVHRQPVEDAHERACEMRCTAAPREPLTT